MVASPSSAGASVEPEEAAALRDAKRRLDAVESVLAFHLFGPGVASLDLSDPKSAAGRVEAIIIELESLRRYTKRLKRELQNANLPATKLGRLATLWTEYAELTRRDWVCNRARDLRGEIRALLGGKR